jgi:hypothetical protein
VYPEQTVDEFFGLTPFNPDVKKDDDEKVFVHISSHSIDSEWLCFITGDES